MAGVAGRCAYLRVAELALTPQLDHFGTQRRKFVGRQGDQRRIARARRGTITRALAGRHGALEVPNHVSTPTEGVALAPETRHGRVASLLVGQASGAVLDPYVGVKKLC